MFHVGYYQIIRNLVATSHRLTENSIIYCNSGYCKLGQQYIAIYWLRPLTCVIITLTYTHGIIKLLASKQQLFIMKYIFFDKILLEYLVS